MKCVSMIYYENLTLRSADTWDFIYCSIIRSMLFPCEEQQVDLYIYTYVCSLLGESDLSATSLTE